MCWHNSKALAQSDLACVCVYIRVRESSGPRGAGISRGTARGGGSPLPFVHDLPGHVTTGSHRDTGQSETRGQRVKAACLFHCLCGVPHC